MESALFVCLLILFLLFSVIEIYSVCKCYRKVEIAPWKGIIPIWNILSLFRLANLSNWMVILIFIPGLNLYILYLVYAALADRLFQKRSFGLGLLFLPFIFFPILAFTTKKKDLKVEETHEEENSFTEEVIEPLKAMPDLDEIYASNEGGENRTSIPVLQEENVVLNQIKQEESSMNIITSSTSQDVQQVLEEKPILNLEEYKTCPNCGTKLDVGATTCFLCGSQLIEEKNL